jgi:hypothetical protein
MINALLLDMLEQEDADAGAAAVVGLAKLMLSGMITDEEVRSPPLRVRSSQTPFP